MDFWQWYWQWQWRFLLTAEERKLTFGAWSKEHDTSVFAGFLCWKKEVRRSYPFPSVQHTLIAGSKSFCFARMGSESFCRLIEKCFCRWLLPRSELFCFSVIAKLFLPGFLSLIASLKATGDASSLFQYSQLVLLLHFHDRHASYSCLVAVSTTLAQCYSPGYFLLYSKFKTISVTGRPTSSCFQFIYVSGRFTTSYFFGSCSV